MLESNTWSRSESYQAQLEWQKRLGLATDNHNKGGKISGPKNAKKELTCEHCGKTKPYMEYIRHHGKNCKVI